MKLLEFLCLFLFLKAVLNAGKDCWRGCGRKQGACDWCGAGVCCRKGWWDTRNGCDGSIGGNRRHECVEGMRILRHN